MASGVYVTSYRKDMRLLGTMPRRVWLVVLVVVLLYLPTVMEERNILGYYLTNAQLLGLGLPQINQALIAILGAIALNLLVGYAGLLSLGHAAFFAVGAMVAGIVGTQWGAPFPVALLAAGVAGGVIGTVVGLPSLRVRGLYLLLATLALHFITLYVFLEYQLDNFGPAGVPFDPPELGPLTIDTDTKWYFLLLVFVVATILLSKNLLRTREGRAFVAIRDHDIAAGSLGVNVAAVKLKAFALSSFIVSVAGALFAYYLGTATRESFTLNFVIEFYAMIIIGGMGSLLGAVLGALLWQLLPGSISTLSGEVDPETPVFGDLLGTYQEQTVLVLFGVLIILILVFKPEGLNGIWQSTKRAFVRWPYTT
jgi:branched-chain amino acid transport system permease protein